MESKSESENAAGFGVVGDIHASHHELRDPSCEPYALSPEP